MALRILTSTRLLLQELVRNRAPVVADPPLSADDLPYRNLLRAVARLEHSRPPQEVVPAVQALQRWLPKPGCGGIATVVRGLDTADSLERWRRGGASLPAGTLGILMAARS